MKKIIIACTLCVLGCMTAVSAQSKLTAESNRTTGEITLKGNTGKDSGEYVFAVICDENDTKDGFTLSEFSNKAYAVSQTKSNENGDFELSMKLEERYTSDTYNCIVITTGGESFSSKLDYISPYDVKNALLKLSGLSIEETAEFVAVFEDSRELFATKTTVYDTEGFDKERFAKIMIGMRPEGGYADETSFNALVNLSEHIIELDMITDVKLADEYMLKYSEKLMLDSRYKDAKEEIRLGVCGYIVESELTSPAVLNGIIKDRLVVEEFVKAEYWNDYVTLVDRYKDYITIDSDSEKKLTSVSKEDVCQQMYKDREKIKTTADIIEIYEDAIKTVYDKKNKKPSGSNGAGGGGGGGGGGFVSGGGVTPYVDKTSQTQAPSQQTEKFTDLGGFEWAKDAIYALADKGVISGYDDSTFKPSSNVKREEFVKMLVCLYEVSKEGDVSSFEDADRNAWYYDYIKMGVGAQLVFGISESRFGVGMPITRQDLAVMAYRAMKTDFVPEKEATFSDFDEVSDYAKTAVMVLSEKGIISGDEKGNFRPKDNATRAEAARILYLLK